MIEFSSSIRSWRTASAPRQMARAVLVSAVELSWSATAVPVAAQEPVLASPDHEVLLASSDPALTRNKRLVHDFYREVFQGLHMDRTGHFLTERYIQHNPTVPTGR